MKETKGRTGEILFLIAGIVLLALILVMSFFAVSDMNEDYQSLKEMDLSEDASETIIYYDHLYAALGFGIEIDHNDSGKDAALTDFLASSLRSIDRRIMSCGILYVMMIVTVSAYYLYRKFGQNKKKHVLSAAAAPVILYAVFIAAIAVMHLAMQMPFCLPTGYEWPLIAVGLLAVMGGNCFLAWLLRLVRIKRTVSVVAIPLVLVLFIFGAVLEGKLYSPPTVDSFDYVYEIEESVLDEDYEGEVYYDSEKNMIVLNGKEYPPEQADNPDFLRGAGRTGAFLFELLNPYSGNGLFMVYDILKCDESEMIIHPVLLILYAVKAAAFIGLPLCIRKKTGSAEGSGAEA